MTIKDIEQMKDEVLTAAMVAPLLKADPTSIRKQAQADPAKLGFPVAVVGNRVKIPKAGFIAWFNGEYIGKKEDIVH